MPIPTDLFCLIITQVEITSVACYPCMTRVNTHKVCDHLCASATHDKGLAAHVRFVVPVLTCHTRCLETRDLQLS